MTHTAENTYRVWLRDSRPEHGKLIRAASSIDARRICAEAWGKSVDDVMARRDYGTPS